MSIHSRSFNRLSVWIVLVVFFASIIAQGQWALASPDARSPVGQAVAQSDKATPPLIEPVDNSEDDGGLLPVSITENLGNGGQPEDLPREIAVGDSRFLFDRIVPLRRQDMTRIAQESSLIVYAFGDQGPFDAVYVSVPDRSEDELARYLPQRFEDPAVACPAEAVNAGTLETEDTTYVFVGLETDLTPEMLQEVGQSNGQSIYTDPNVEQPFPELFVEDEAGLLRFGITSGDVRPVALAESLAFEGMLFAFSGDVTDQVAPETITKVGCAGPWAVFVDQADPTSANRYVQVGGRLFQFIGESVPVDSPTEVPTESPTEVPTESPTEEPTEVPTEQPTESPTEIPTVEPTEAPSPEPTAVPTESPTEEPSAEPTAVPSEEPTEPSEQATESPTEIPVAEPTEQPTSEATESPTEGPTPQPTVQLQPPAYVPTQVPNAPPPAAVTAEPATSCAGSAGPTNAQGLPSYLPGQLQLGGIAYAFAATQPQDEAGELTRIGCAGAFEILVSDQADRSEVIYLRSAGELYRYEAAQTFNVEFEVVGQPQRIRTEEQQFRLVDVWVPSIYSSTSVILFVDEPEDTQPEMFYALNVYSTVIGDVVGEYRLAGEDDQPSSEMIAAAEQAGINPDLTVEGTRYLLVSVFAPVGTTTNGFVTLFSANAEVEAEMLLGRDKRQLELFIYDAIPVDQDGG